MNRLRLSIVVVLVTAATLGSVVGHDFVGWDDYDTIKWNSHFRPPTWAGLAYYWTHSASGLYIPLTYTVWWVLAVAAKTQTPSGSVELSPWVFHAANVLLHLLSALLVLDVLLRLFKTPWAALVGALVFAIHPLQVEPVAWASGLKDVLAGLLCLATLRQCVLFVQNDSRLHYATALFAHLLAMLAKPSAVVAPLVAGAVCVGIMRQPFSRVLRWLAPMLMLSIPCIIWSRMVQQAYPETDTPLWTRPLIAADALAFYLRKLVLPWPLAVTYGRTPNAVVQSGAIYFTWIVPAVLTVLLWLGRRRTPELIAAAVIFVGALSPVLGFARFSMQIHSTVTDHYMYLPMFGVAVAATWTVSRWNTTFVRAACVAVLAGLAILSHMQSRHWQNSVALFRQAVAVNPENVAALGNLGRAMGEAGKLDQAAQYLARAVALSPDSWESRVLLAQALVFSGRFAEALPHAQAALQLAEKSPASDTVREHFLLGKALAGVGQLEQAEMHLVLALLQRPTDTNLAAELQRLRDRMARGPATQP